MPRNELTPSAPSPARQVRNKWGATALDNAQFADHHGSISLLTDDPNVRKAAEFKLELERKLRPTEEEREQKLAEIAADALARREAGRARLAGLKEAREGAEEAAKQKAQVERRMRSADNALARALVPAASRKAGFNKDEPWMEYTAEEGMELERSVSEAREAGNGGHVVYGERVRQGITRLNQLRAAAGEYTNPASPSMGAGLGYTPIPSSE